MANSVKPVQFDLLKPFYLQRDDSGVSREYLYDLSSLLHHVETLPPMATQKKILGDIYVIQICNHDANLKIWELQLLRLREKVLPGIADEEGNYALIQLGDNEYPAESTTLLYDETNHTLYMQRNIFAVSIRALEEYLEMLSPENTSVCLKPVIIGDKISKITPEKLYRKLILVADANDLSEEDQDSSLGQILRATSRYQGRIVKLDLGFGRHKTGLLNAHNTTELVQEAYNYTGTSKLILRMAEDEDTAVETIDLMNDRAFFVIRVEYSRSNPITHERLFRMCLGRYKEDNAID